MNNLEKIVNKNIVNDIEEKAKTITNYIGKPYADSVGGYYFGGDWDSHTYKGLIHQSDKLEIKCFDEDYGNDRIVKHIVVSSIIKQTRKFYFFPITDYTHREVFHTQDGKLNTFSEDKEWFDELNEMHDKALFAQSELETNQAKLKAQEDEKNKTRAMRINGIYQEP